MIECFQPAKKADADGFSVHRPLQKSLCLYKIRITLVSGMEKHQHLICHALEKNATEWNLFLMCKNSVAI
jgi:hypothetical protein